MLSSINSIKTRTYFLKNNALYCLENEVSLKKKALKFTFKILNLPFVSEEDKENYAASKAFRHSITITGKRCFIMKNFKIYT